MVLRRAVCTVSAPSPQTVDIFGEVSGLSFSPDAGTLFVAIADPTYGSLLQLDRVGGEGRFATPAKS